MQTKKRKYEEIYCYGNNAPCGGMCRLCTEL